MLTRRRLYLLGIIMILGLLIGIFLLPGGEKNPAEVTDTPKDKAKEVSIIDHPGPLPDADISKTPGAKAEALVKKALATANPQEKAQLLVEAWNTDPTGRWGGEAAAEIGNIWKASDVGKAKQWYAVAQKAPVSPETLAKITAELDAIAKTETTVATVPIKTVPYKVQAGDSLWKIARANATTAEAIKKASGLANDNVRVDMVLKIPKGPFDAVVTKHTHILQLLQEGKCIKAYEVGLGTSENTTPTGAYTVANKLVNPVWYSDGGRIPSGDPRNILGTRWIGFNGRIGIHGCPKAEESTIGKDVSKGCVRMREADVHDVYDYLVEGKSKVTVVD